MMLPGNPKLTWSMLLRSCGIIRHGISFESVLALACSVVCCCNTVSVGHVPTMSKALWGSHGLSLVLCHTYGTHFLHSLSRGRLKPEGGVMLGLGFGLGLFTKIFYVGGRNRTQDLRIFYYLFCLVRGLGAKARSYDVIISNMTSSFIIKLDFAKD